MTVRNATNAPTTAFTVNLPERHAGDVDQDEEWCELVLDGTRRRLRFHDYGEIYAVPGLYEHLFYDRLKCESPATVRALLEHQVRLDGADAADLRVLDVGAGNGMVGEQLADMGAGTLVGIDILEEAAAAAQRDRPDTYDDYLVADLIDSSADAHRKLGEHRFNCLTTVAALGFGDIPPAAFAQAHNLLECPAWVAFNIKEDFLDGADSSGFARLIRRMLEEGALEQRAQRRYRHRLSMAGEPLHYVAIVAVKRADVAPEWVDELEGATP